MIFKFAEVDKEGKPTGNVLNQWEFNPKQEQFWKSIARVVLFSGGFGCGKSLMLVLKAIDLSLRYPGNFILMGRQTYIQLRDTLIKEFVTICPQYLLDGDFRRGEMKAIFKNGSEIIFRHLDKVSESEIRSMNLGAAFIDQAEDVTEGVFKAIRGRLRREGIKDGERKIYMSINPEFTWHYAAFKQNKHPDYELIEGSMLDNRKNLPEEYVKDHLELEKEDPTYFKQYVLGVWDESLLAKNAVIPQEFLNRLFLLQKNPVRTVEGIDIYYEFIPGHRYQLGIDVAEGSEEETEKKDKSSITLVDLTTLEEVAHWTGQLPPDVVAEKGAFLARMYQNNKTGPCVIIPEMNSIGLTIVNKLQKEDDIYLYRREEFDKSVGKRLKKLGWRTTRQSKPLLVNHFVELMRKKNPRVYSKTTVAQMKTFVYSDEARKAGMGAKTGFHDDDVMSCFLAFFEKGEVTPGVVLRKEEKSGKIMVHTSEIQPTLTIVNGKARIKGFEPEKVRTWNTT